MSSITLESECTEDERALLRRVLTQNKLTGKHLEIGTAAGGTLKELINAYPHPANRPPFFVIDPLRYFEHQLEKIHTNLRSAGIDPTTVTFWEGTSEDFVGRERTAGTIFDFVFIDGNHSHYPVMVDLQWADMVNPGGFVCMHDHRMGMFPGVVWSATHFLNKNPNFTVQEKVDSLIVLKKTAAGAARGVTGGDLTAARIAQALNKVERSLKKRLKF